jgi:predicted TIM-barrel fold metal-dependent hydrolase
VIIDVHGHLSAPPELYAYKSLLLSARGAHGQRYPTISDERMLGPAGKHRDELAKVGTDHQLISPRPYQLMHSEPLTKIVNWWVQANNDLIARVCKAFPETFSGVCALPQGVDGRMDLCVEELERCVTELGFVGCLLNPDPAEGIGDVPTMDSEYWYPLYEKMVELDVPALIHPASCRNERETFGSHFITEESIAVVNLCKDESRVFTDFPTLKLIVAHGGGSVPYQIGRWRAGRLKARARGYDVETFDEVLRHLRFDTVLYNKESLRLLFDVVGADRCLFGTEVPGAASVADPATGRALEDLKPVIESLDLTEHQRDLIFSGNAFEVFPRLAAVLKP